MREGTIGTTELSSAQGCFPLLIPCRKRPKPPCWAEASFSLHGHEAEGVAVAHHVSTLYRYICRIDLKLSIPADVIPVLRHYHGFMLISLRQLWARRCSKFPSSLNLEVYWSQLRRLFKSLLSICMYICSDREIMSLSWPQSGINNCQNGLANRQHGKVSAKTDEYRCSAGGF